MFTQFERNQRWARSSSEARGCVISPSVTVRTPYSHNYLISNTLLLLMKSAALLNNITHTTVTIFFL